MVPRDPDGTRQKILEAAQEEIRRVGFQAASVNRILDQTGLTKGAFYHHFDSKSALGLALINEVVREEMRRRWIRPLQEARDPVRALQQALIRSREELQEGEIVCGCPLNNLSQEMSTLDEDFRKSIQDVYREWIDGFQRALEQGQEFGTVQKAISAKGAATSIVAMMEGCIGLVKNAQDPSVIDTIAPTIVHFLESLRVGESEHGE